MNKEEILLLINDAPEELRVVKASQQRYLVQTRRSPKAPWVTQAEHQEEAAARRDCQNWYR